VLTRRLVANERVRRRLAVAGAGALGDGELLAILLACDDADAAALLRRLGGLVGLARAGVRQIAAFTDDALACRVEAAFELGRRAVDVPVDAEAPVRSPGDVAARLGGRLAALEREELHVLGLDAHNRVVTHFVAAAGEANQVFANPRDVFRPLVRDGALAAVVAHNHPSGSPEPSSEDADLTRRLAEAGRIVGVTLLDHVVLARGGRYSFAEQGRIPSV
jgi:DNA repair protein RadC